MCVSKKEKQKRQKAHGGRNLETRFLKCTVEIAITSISQSKLACERAGIPFGSQV